MNRLNHRIYQQSDQPFRQDRSFARSALSRQVLSARWLVMPVALLLLALLLVSISSGPVLAQGTDQPGAAGEVTANDVNDVAEDLWCPLCSGVRLDACELKACDQMKDVIAIKLSEGESAEEIKAYFLDQYGPQVLGEPPREGFNWLAWIMPFAVLLAGGGFLWYRARHMFGAGDDLATAVASGPAGAGRSADSGESEKDSYDRKLEEELNRYG